MACLETGEERDDFCGKKLRGALILDATTIPKTPPVASQRARGAIRLSGRVRGASTVIEELHQSGSFKLLFPRHSDAALQAVVLNTAGGVTGGDQFRLAVKARAESHLVLTTQAAERIYRAQPGEIGSVRTNLTLEDGAQLDWLPQETILFDRAALDRSINISMKASSRFLSCETLVFGRKTMGETVQDLYLRDRFDLRIDGKLAFADRLRLDGDAEKQLLRKAISDGANAMTSIVFAAKDAAQNIDTLRELLPETGGASALTNDLIFLRILREDSYYLRQSVIPVLAHLNQAALPRTWMI